MARPGARQTCGPSGEDGHVRLDLVGLAEAAELLTVSKAVLCERRRRPGDPGDSHPVFPKPVAELKCGPVWLRDQIESYREESERLASLRLSGGCPGPIDPVLERVLARWED